MMNNDHRELQFPSRCPICTSERGFASRRVTIAGSLIYRCINCRGYLLYPEVKVEYNDSHWSKNRELTWDRDVRIALEFAPLIVETLRTHVSGPIKNVLEIGCGTAFMGKGFESVGCEYAGIDVDFRSVEFARQKGLNVYRGFAEDILESRIADISYDLVISSNVLEHVNNPLRVMEIVRHLSKGIVVIIVPNPEGLFARMKASTLVRNVINRVLNSQRDVAYSIDGCWHNVAYSRDTLRYLCDAVGLIPLQISQMGINDPVFGFVQRNGAVLYRLASSCAHVVGLDSELLLVGKVR